jgi:hypothetical protein
MQILMRSVRSILQVLLAALALPPLHAQDVSPDAVVKRYLAARTYCETGKWSYPPAAQVRFSLCADRDGHFKFVQHAGEPREEVLWSSDTHIHRYRHDTHAYEERPRAVGQMEGVAPGRAPAATSRLLRETWGRGGAVDGMTPLAGFAPNAELSTPTYAVVGRFDTYWGFTERLSVRRSDGAMLRYEQLAGNKLRHVVELSTVQLDRPLTPDELSFRPPLLHRYSLQNSPKVFFAGVLVATACLGALAWACVFAFAADTARVLRVRSRLWRWWWWAFAVAAVAIGGLTVLALVSPGSGHPPAIIIPMLLASFGGAAFAIAGCLLLASYPAQRLTGAT